MAVRQAASNPLRNIARGWQIVGRKALAALPLPALSGRLESGFSALKRTAVPLWPMGYGGVFGEPPPPVVTDLAEHYLRNEAVFTAVEDIAGRVSSTPLELYKRGAEDESKLNAHDVFDLLNRPNEFLTGIELLRHTVLDLKLTGNAYWFLAGPRSGAPTEIWRLHPRHTRIVLSKRQFITGYVTDVDGETVSMSAREVIHFRNPNPFGYFGLYGLSTLAAAAMSAQTGRDMAEWNRSMFARNHAVPAGLVSFEDFVDDETYAQAKQDWRENYGGGERRTAFVRGGRVQFQPIGLTQTDLDFLSGAKWEADKIYSVFGCHHLRGGQSGSKETSAKNNERLFLEGTLWPLLLMLSARLSNDLAPFFGPVRGAGRLRLAFADPRPRERALELDEKREREKRFTFNEARVADGLDPLDGGDDVLYTHVVQNGLLLPMEQATQPQPPAPVLGETPPEDDPPSDEVGETAEERAERREAAGDDIGDDIGDRHDKSAAQPVQEEPPSSQPAAPDAIRAELRRWEQFTLKRWGQEDARPFRPEAVPPFLYRVVEKALAEAADEAAARDIFARARTLVDGGLSAGEALLPEPQKASVAVGINHVAEVVDRSCPMCGSSPVHCFPDHGGVCVCPTCEQAFDPAAYDAAAAGDDLGHAVGNDNANEVRSE